MTTQLIKRDLTTEQVATTIHKLADDQLADVFEGAGTIRSEARAEIEERVRGYYTEDKLSQKAIGERFGRSTVTISRWMQEFSIPVRGQGAGGGPKPKAKVTPVVTSQGGEVLDPEPKDAAIDQVARELETNTALQTGSANKVVVDVMNYLSAAHSELEKLSIHLAKHEPTNGGARAKGELDKIRQLADKIEAVL